MHVQGFYGPLDRLRAAHPTVAFESRSGGGGKIDLGVLARTEQVWTSDNTDPLDRLAVQHGFSRLHPDRVMAAWVTDSPNVQRQRSPQQAALPVRERHGGGAGRRGRPLGLERGGAGGGARLGPALQGDQAAGPARRAVPAAAPEGGLSAVQYVRDEETVVLTLLQARSYGERPPALRLRGVETTAAYVCADTGAVHQAGCCFTREFTPG